MTPRPSYPSAVEVAASVAAATVVLALGAASAASGAMIPLLWGVDLAIHEFGHMVTYWVPVWQVTAAAGSAFQVAVPLGVAWYLAATRRYRTAGILLAWAGCSARNVAVYIGDAPYRQLALIGGENSLHDWAQLLAGRQMQYAEPIAWVVNGLGWLLVAAGFALALAPVVVVARNARRAELREAELAARREELPVREPHWPIG